MTAVQDEYHVLATSSKLLMQESGPIHLELTIVRSSIEVWHSAVLCSSSMAAIVHDQELFAILLWHCQGPQVVLQVKMCVVGVWNCKDAGEDAEVLV